MAYYIAVQLQTSAFPSPQTLSPPPSFTTSLDMPSSDNEDGFPAEEDNRVPGQGVDDSDDVDGIV